MINHRGREARQTGDGGTGMSEAGVYTARGIAELHQMVSSLACDGFRIVTVIDTQNGDYRVAAQRAALQGEGT